MAATDTDDVLTADEVASWLRVPLTWVQAAARDGRLPSWKAGRYRRFSRADIEHWKRQQTAGDPLTTDRRRRGRRTA